MKVQTPMTSLLALLVGVLMTLPVLQGANAEDACDNGTWANCGLAVKQELDTAPSLDRVIALGSLWGRAYDAQFNELRKKHQIESAVPDSEKIYEALKSKIDPLDIVIDHGREALIKRYLPRLAFVAKWASGPIGQALSAFFTPSDIATDYDELRLMDDQLQEEIITSLGPALATDWNDRLKAAVDAAAPQLQRP